MKYELPISEAEIAHLDTLSTEDYEALFAHDEMSDTDLANLSVALTEALTIPSPGTLAPDALPLKARAVRMAESRKAKVHRESVRDIRKARARKDKHEFDTTEHDDNVKLKRRIVRLAHTPARHLPQA